MQNQSDASVGLKPEVMRITSGLLRALDKPLLKLLFTQLSESNRNTAKDLLVFEKMRSKQSREEHRDFCIFLTMKNEDFLLLLLP